VCAVFGYRGRGGLGSRFGVDEEAVVGFEGHHQVCSTEPVVVVGDQCERELKRCTVEPGRRVIALYLRLGGLRRSIAGDRPLWATNGDPVSLVAYGEVSGGECTTGLTGDPREGSH
jgi:hypothetical protein